MGQVYPVNPDGLIVPVMVGMSASKIADLSVDGGATSRPILLRGEIDTGSNITAVSPLVLSQLGIQPKSLSSTSTVSGHTGVSMFDVSLSILNSAANSTFLTRGDLEVMQLPRQLPIDVLIGLDILLGTKFSLDGPARTFTIEI